LQERQFQAENGLFAVVSNFLTYSSDRVEIFTFVGALRSFKECDEMQSACEIKELINGRSKPKNVFIGMNLSEF
jgi:hypothetical protein